MRQASLLALAALALSSAADRVKVVSGQAQPMTPSDPFRAFSLAADAVQASLSCCLSCQDDDLAPAAPNFAHAPDSLPSPSSAEGRPPDLFQTAEEPLPHPTSAPEDPAAFLSFEEWKALQLSRAYTSSSVSSQASSAARPGPTAPVAANDTGATSPDVPANPAEPAETDKESSSSAVAAPSKSAKPVGGGGSSSRRFNYASTDCSARVHYSSRLTKSASSLLHKSRDRYMLTPCSSPSHFVVIELCDEIRIDTLEVGNFEFFSSIVKGVRVRAGDTEAGENDEEGWKDVGSFEMENVRGMQSFKWETPTSFHRFIRLDFLGHYGNEYYCPVSLVRIYGLNQMEAYRYELSKEKERERAHEMEREKERAIERTVEAEPARQDPLAVAATSEPPQPTGTGVPISPPVGSDTAQVPSLSPSSAESITPRSSPTPAPTPAVPVNDISNSLSISPSILSSTVSTPTSSSEVSLASQNARAPSISSVDPSMGTPPAPSTPSSSVASQSPSILTSTITVTQSPAARAPPPPPPPPPILQAAPSSDSHESIYAFIIRRLTSLESNSSLATHYIEQQSRLMRGAFEKMEREVRGWKTEIEKEERERWKETAENLRTQQSRALKAALRTYDTRLDSLLSLHTSMTAQLEALDAEVVLQRRLLALAAVLLGTVLVCFFVIRLGGIEIRKGDSLRRQRIRERERERVARERSDDGDGKRERPSSPRPTEHRTPHRPASPRPFPSRTKHLHSASAVPSSSTPRRSFSAARPTSPTAPHLALPSSAYTRPRSSLSQHTAPSNLPASSSRRAAARTAHLHSLPIPASLSNPSSASAQSSAASHATSFSGSKRQRTTTLAAASATNTPGVSSSSSGPSSMSPRRFGSPSFLVNLASPTASHHSNVGLGISSPLSPLALGKRSGEGSAHALADEGNSTEGEADDDEDDVDGRGGQTGGEETDEGWTAATSTDEEGDSGLSLDGHSDDDDGAADETFVLGRVPPGRKIDMKSGGPG